MKKRKTTAYAQRKKALTTPNRGKVTEPKPNPNALTVNAKPGDDPAAIFAQTFLRPTVQAAFTVQAYHKGSEGELGIGALVTALDEQVDAVNGGNLGRAEARLLAQAHTLDAIFGNLARRAVVQEQLLQYETHLRLALKAQSQCRTTLETLAAIKNPPVIYARQANIANGPQQVNNGVPSQAREIENQQSKLLEAQHGERLDGTAAGAASGADPQLAPVGEINRPEDGIRESTGIEERRQGRDVANVARAAPRVEGARRSPSRC